MNSNSINDQTSNGYIWLALYFLCNLSLTLYNKVVMQFVGFNYPWMLTGLHTLCSAFGCYFCVYGLQMFRPASLGSEERWVMIAFSFLYTINIVVPFHQVVRATTPVFTIIMSVMFFSKRFSPMIYISLVPVVLGVALATLGEYNYSTLGFVLTLLGTFLASLKTIVTNVVQVGRLKLHPLDLLLRMSPLAFLQCLVYAYFSGELEKVVDYSMNRMSFNSFLALLFNGFIAFLLNVVSFTANKKTSALTMTVAANVKQVLSIGLAVIIFNLTITAMNAWGILLTLAGGAWYTSLEIREKNRTPPPPLRDPVGEPLIKEVKIGVAP